MEHTSSLPSDSALQALEDRLPKYDTGPPSVKLKDVLTQDELDEKNKLLDELESRLLPSIQEQLGPLVASLGLRSDSKRNFELTYNILSTLEETCWNTILCIESISGDMNMTSTHDYHFKRCKFYRCCELMLIPSTLSDHLHPLFMRSIELIKASKVSSNYAVTPECQNLERRLLRDAAEFSDFTRQTIKWLQGSDLYIIQEEWREKEDQLDVLLQVFTDLTHPTSVRQPNKTSALRKHVNKLADLTIPLVKLTRIFSKKVSNTATTKLPFTLDTNLNSRTLSTLHELPESIERYFYQVVKAFREAYTTSELVDLRIVIGHPLRHISHILETTLVLLALYLIPLPTTDTSRDSPESIYKAWFSAWQEAWHGAFNNISCALQTFEG
ncbi:hypothetical protein PTTG_27530 [Puccinia triticina 1-1 BBBD Race 1]|uniref:Uncharacterized protein n=2 Tax=Puccinia triticina TaxID=208348 RepID=A0A180GJI9_PUCT1|nr:uncharacterized protein PtA15_3A438 [Puccinia triticina]OAV92761.1 hypothetical protein PTTG_27530 [Puccinia triticina 1-1 BBBD Race 1]WAQ83071.1 hypothetical protein PtA15_3A438 [Puccinia triticina]WAR53909.1 hypothetical protein PtB15_3B418 [Puccinia triticina]